jgi:hypothetical protein
VQRVYGGDGERTAQRRRVHVACGFHEDMDDDEDNNQGAQSDREGERQVTREADDAVAEEQDGGEIADGSRRAAKVA